MELMVGYFWKMKNPLLPLHYASLGFRLMKSGKIPLSFSSRGQPDLHHLFQKVRELENQE
jgi:heterodisulfide reductase subunit C